MPVVDMGGAIQALFPDQMNLLSSYVKYKIGAHRINIRTLRDVLGNQRPIATIGAGAVIYFILRISLLTLILPGHVYSAIIADSQRRHTSRGSGYPTPLDPGLAVF